MVDHIHKNVEINQVLFTHGSYGEGRYYAGKHSVTKRYVLCSAPDASNPVVEQAGTSEVTRAVSEHGAVDADGAQAFAKVEIADEVVKGKEILDSIPVLDGYFIYNGKSVCTYNAVQERNTDRGVDLHSAFEQST